MAVNWSWKYKMGSYDNEQGTTINIYQGNCLAVFIYDFIEDGVEKYQFVNFWNDIHHLKRCLGLEKVPYEDKKYNIYEGTINWRLNTYYKDTNKIANALTKAGLNVELYYEEPKGEQE